MPRPLENPAPRRSQNRPGAMQFVVVGAGDFACNLYWQSVSLYLLFFYTDVLGVSAALGGTLYIVPYMLGVQMTQLHGQRVEKLVPMLVSNLNPDVALPLCYLSGIAVGVMGLFAVYYNLRSTGPRPATSTPEATR